MKVDEETSRRFALMSFICACLVVGIHLPATTEGVNAVQVSVKHFLTNGICRIAVPFFFVAAGFFLGLKVGLKDWYISAIKKRIFTLLLPYICWSILGCLIIYGLSCLSVLYYRQPMIRFDYNPIHLFGLDFVPTHGMFLLWFVRSLYILVIISPLFVWCIRHGLILFVFVCALTAIHFLGVVEDAPVVKWIERILSWQGVFYFPLGMALAINNRTPRICAHRWHWLCLGSGALLFALEASVAPSLACIRHVGIILFMFGMYNLIPAMPLTGCFKGVAFPIYLVHLFPLMAFSMFMHAVTKSLAFNRSLVGYFVYWLSAIVVCIIFANLLHRYFPRIAKVLFGGR